VVAGHVDDADGDEDLGVNHALRCELLDHAPGEEFVVVGVDEPLADGLEGVKEAGEISEFVEVFGLGKGERLGIVAGAQLDQRGGHDGAFEVQVQLGLGEAVDEDGNIGHSSSLVLFGGLTYLSRLEHNSAMEKAPIRTSIDLPRDLHRRLHEAAARKGCSARKLILAGIERAVEDTQPTRPKRRLSLDTPLIPPAGRKLDMTNEEIYELIEFP
jgi:hypothetical protein